MPESTQTRTAVRTPPGDRRIILAAAGIAAAVIAVAGSAFALQAGQPDIAGRAVPLVTQSAHSADAPSVPSGMVRLVPAAAAGPAPFAAAIRVAVPTLSSDAVAAVAAARANWPIDPTVGVALVEGSSAGVYVGDPGQPDCRVSELGTAVTAAGAATGAWAAALGIAPDQVTSYLATLTPVLLGSDSWLAVSDLTAGAAVPTAAVLQAGTAVLIDASGTPRVRCADAAPLTAADALPFADQLTTGVPWAGYDPASVIGIRPALPMTQISLISLTSGVAYAQSLHAPPAPAAPASSTSPAPPPASTVGPTTLTVTAPAPAPAPAPVTIADAGDLGLSVPMTRPACDGAGAVFLFAAVTPGAYASEIQHALNAFPGSRYLRTDLACTSLYQSSDDGNPIYAVYRPAGRTTATLCAAVAAAGGDAYGKWLDNSTDPSRHVC